MDRASLEQLLGQGLSLAEIGRRLDRHESTVGYWVEKHGLRGGQPGQARSRGVGWSARSWRRWSRQGASIAEIAEAVGSQQGDGAALADAGTA